jgi:hypothetical protein
MVSLEFFIDVNLPALLWPWGWQPLTEMSTRYISWGVEVAGALGWQPYHLHLPIALKSGSIDLLEPSGPVHPCNRIALPFTPKPWLSFIPLMSPLYPSWRCLGMWIIRFCQLRFRLCSSLIITLVTDATALGVWASARICYVNSLNQPTGSDNL